MEVDVSDFGAVLLSVRVPDKKGVSTDVLLTYPSLEYFYSNPCEFGAYVGRNGNRIGEGCVTIEGVEYQLEKNNQAKLQLEAERLELDKQKVRNDKDFNDKTIDLKEKQVQAQVAQIFDANPYNDKIKAVVG